MLEEVVSRASRRTLWLIVAVAIALRGYPWLRPHTLFGVMEVDDGVYYGSAKMLLHGHMPYDDFTIVHPPVTSMLLLPFAGLGELLGDPVGMASARVAIGLVGIVNVLLVHRLAGKLGSPRAALAAAAIYAVMPNVVIAEQTVLLEPLVNLGCLVAVLLLLRGGRREAGLAGVLLAAAGGVKVFAVVYVVAIVIWLVVSRRRELLVPVLGGMALGAVVLIGPYVALAPSAFWHDVVTTQLSRPRANTAGGLVTELDGVLPHVLSVLTVLVLAVAVVTVAVLWERRAPRSPMTLWLLVTGLGVLSFRLSSSYFPHYSAFLIPPIAMILSRAEPRRLGAVALAALVLCFTGASIRDDSRYTSQGDWAALGALVPDGACVHFESISYAIAADVFTIPSKDCPAWIDGRGVNLTQSTDWRKLKRFYPAGFLANDGWQRDTVDQMARADFLLLKLEPQQTIEWTADTKTYALDHFTPVWVHRGGDRPVQLWQRTR